MEIFNYSDKDGQYLSTGTADESPLEPGVFIIPASATVVAPPELSVYEAAVITAARDGWDVVADYVGTDYWLADGSKHTITELGVALPVDALSEKPEELLENLKIRHVEAMKTSCAAAITAGIDHDALGDLHHYPIQPTDQVNMSGLIARSQLLGVGGEPYKFWCADGGGMWARRGHTLSQIASVGLAFSAHVISCQDKYELKLSEINNAETSIDLYSIIW